MNKYKIKFSNGGWTELHAESYAQAIEKAGGELHVMAIECAQLSESKRDPGQTHGQHVS